MNKLYKAGLLRVSGESNDMAASKRVYDVFWLADYRAESTVIVQEGVDKAGVHIQVSSLFVIPLDSKNAEKVVTMIAYFSTDDYFILNKYGIEGYTFKCGVDGVSEKLSNELGYSDSFKLKFDFSDNYFARKYAFVYNIDTQIAFPSSQEMDCISVLFPGLNTYSAELMAFFYHTCMNWAK
ncbi:MAG: hypothetical protein LBJ41_02490 [Treponema sp.]|jgi:hypothetical protein|nr:hypothetical protein [Treponema sp.]